MQDRRLTSRSKISYYIGQAERGGQTNRLHFQVYVQANHKVKLDKWRSFFTFNDKSFHIVHPIKGSSDDNIAYCSKDDTRATLEMPGEMYESTRPNPFSWGQSRDIAAPKQGERNDLSELKKSIENQENWVDIYSNHFEAIAKCASTSEQYYNLVGQKKAHEAAVSYYQSQTLRPWQQRLVDFCESPVHNRQVVYIWESTGGVGKSFMAGYLQVMCKAVILQPAKKADLLYILSKHVREPGCNTIVFDVSCSNAEYGMDVVYTVAEHCKDGRMLVTKYNSCQYRFDPKHVIIFSNNPPDLQKLKADRWTVIHLTGINLTMPQFIRQPLGSLAENTF